MACVCEACAPPHSLCTVRAQSFNTSDNRILKSVKSTKNQDKLILKFDCNRIFKSVLQIRQTEFWWLTGSLGLNSVTRQVSTVNPGPVGPADIAVSTTFSRVRHSALLLLVPAIAW